MKTLILLRHAKSSWDYPELSDFERPLNKRGNRDAPKMGQWLKNNIGVPDMVICSPSVRTLATISKVGHALGLKGEDYTTDKALYHASPAKLDQIVRSCPDQVGTLMIVGHNPGLTDFANQLYPDSHISNIPTCGVFGVQFPVNSWKDISAKNSEFLFFQYPKNLP